MIFVQGLWLLWKGLIVFVHGLSVVIKTVLSLERECSFFFFKVLKLLLSCMEVAACFFFYGGCSLLQRVWWLTGGIRHAAMNSVIGQVLWKVTWLENSVRGLEPPEPQHRGVVGGAILRLVW